MKTKTANSFLSIGKVSLIVIFLLGIASCSKEGSDDPIAPEKPVEYIPAKAVEGRVVVAYVSYYGTKIPDPRLCTHICYAFAELYIKDGIYTGFKIQGKEERFNQVIALKKQNPNLKILLSFTHVVDNADNSQGGGFSLLAKNEEYRKQFALDCKEYCKEKGLDGIDLDWEFPGLSWSGHAADPAVDVDNHVLLMKDLRSQLGDKLLLTYAGYVRDKMVITGGSKYIDIKAIDPYVDFVNLMTYDMDAGTKPHNAITASNAYWDIQRTVNAYLNAGVKSNKLVLGIPFYGRVAFSGSPSAIRYNKIITLGSSYKIDNWDDVAKVPYVTYNGTKYCSYDNEKSIIYKAGWALGKGFKGLMYWECEGDDNAFTLSKATWDGVMKY